MTARYDLWSCGYLDAHPAGKNPLSVDERDQRLPVRLSGVGKRSAQVQPVRLMSVDDAQRPRIDPLGQLDRLPILAGLDGNGHPPQPDVGWTEPHVVETQPIGRVTERLRLMLSRQQVRLSVILLPAYRVRKGCGHVELAEDLTYRWVGSVGLELGDGTVRQAAGSGGHFNRKCQHMGEACRT